MKKQLALLLMLVQSHCLFSLSLGSMAEPDQKLCGLEKLSSEEKQALDAWLAKTAPQPAPKPVQEKGKIMHGEFAVTANINLGRFITLDNGLTYDIPSRSRKKTMGWKVGDKVRLVEPVRPTNYKLENTAQKNTIGAKVSTAKTKSE